MKTKAAVLYEVGKPFEIEELELAPLGEGEVLVRNLYSGLCHSDVHLMTGDLPLNAPIVGGHEGSGIVEDVGPGVSRVKPGDHIVMSFIPSCGTCKWCATGQQAICDWGATILEGSLPGGRWPLRGKAGTVGAFCMLGTFSQYSVVHQNSAIRVDPATKMDTAALVGCGVPTGWGSAVNVAAIRPGHVVVIYGIGGIGINAVQGAAMAGAKHVIAVDPLANKRAAAKDFGATHAVGTAAEAHELAKDLTRGVGADSSIVTVGRLDEDTISAAVDAISKGGTVVLTGMGSLTEKTVHVPGTVLGLYKKTIKGTVFGDCNPTVDIPRLIDLFNHGTLKLEELVTKRYALEDVNKGYDDLLAGDNIRGLLVHEH
ncbi:Zn-dependent alcohol dehydrogenase [Cryobacterium sp. M15]|uniref:Zn-dependent alcohol dehydrogenase n=1 Tax=Cryobacterium sp. M15 TaxID=2048291 RepID=UPI000CE3792F|nr:Zn-dependent alcohol dehydrogenase [Cryobacterium sp. M15]